MKIVLHSDDIILLEYWENVFGKNCTVVDDLNDLLSFSNCIIVVNRTALTHDFKGVVDKLNAKENKLLVLDRTANLETAKNFLKFGVKGYGNALMKEHFIRSAVETIKDGMVWLYPEYTTLLIEEIAPSIKNNHVELDQLSSREKEVALLIRDGHTYKSIGLELDITPRTVKAHASHIYTKLNVKDRLGLALLIK